MDDWAENRALGVVAVDSIAVRLWEQLPHGHPRRSTSHRKLLHVRLRQSVRAAVGYGYTVEEISRIAHRIDDEIVNIAIDSNDDVNGFD